VIAAALPVACRAQAALLETDAIVVPEKVDRASDSSLVRANIAGVLATLSSIAMKEKISRFAGASGASRKLDSFEAEVSIADGVEQYTSVRGHHRIFHHVSEIGGLWSFGEIVTMLRTTRDIIDSSATRGEEDADAHPTIRFQGTSADHLWFVTVKGRIYWLDFEGTIRISRGTGEIERLTWACDSGPPETGIASIVWDVNFRADSIAGNAFTIPSDSIFRVVRTGLDQPAEWNLTQYLALGRYGSRVNVRYEP